MAGDAATSRLGRYTLVRSLGAGGMAELFLARADGIGGFTKLVALKRILPHKAASERFVRMLLNEARLVATLDHPNIAQVYDIDCDQGQYFFAMEYVHGQDLRRVLHAAPDRRLQLENALHIAIGVCAGLHHAHEARDPSGRSLDIVHRDVSPSNVLVSYQGAVKLVDFGVAKAASLVSETREGVIKGKYGYMSPEQCLGHPLDRRSDLFAVGILLWELTTGRRLYKISGELVTLQRVVYVDAPRPSRYIESYPPDLERIVMRALARDPAQRYATAEQLQLELETFALEHKLPVSPVSMAMEMRQLFKHRIDAWREAEQAGRSLADHLAELSSEVTIDDSEESELGHGVDELIDGLGASPFAEPTAVTTADKPAPARPDSRAVTVTATSIPQAAATPPAATSTPPPLAAPKQRRSRVLPLIALALVITGFGATWALLLRAPSRTRAASKDPDASDLQIAPAAEDAEPVVAAVEPVVIEPHDAAPEVVPDVEPEVAPEVAPDVMPAQAEPVVVSRKHRKKKHARPAIAARVEPAPKLEERVPIEPPEAPADEPPKPPPVTVRDAGPAPGTVDAVQVRAVVRSHLPEIQACVSRARMEDRDLAGRIVVRIELSGAGRVTGTSVMSSKGASAGLESCMTRAVGTWAFPAPAGGVRAVISYPFAF